MCRETVGDLIGVWGQVEYRMSERPNSNKIHLNTSEKTPVSGTDIMGKGLGTVDNNSNNNNNKGVPELDHVRNSPTQNTQKEETLYPEVNRIHEFFESRLPYFHFGQTDRTP